MFAAYDLPPSETDPHKRYAAVVTSLDEAIGRVLESLDQAGQSDKTFVFFYSDNGAFRLGREVDIGSNEPLRSGGVTCWEGGIRVVALARWPGQIQPGTVWIPESLPGKPVGALLNGSQVAAVNIQAEGGSS